MVKLVLLGVLELLLLLGGLSETIRNCSDSPGNICGSDLKLYASECDFLKAKDLNSDLTILDMEDCLSGKAMSENLSYTNTTNGGSMKAVDSALTNFNRTYAESSFGLHDVNDGRSLRGSNSVIGALSSDVSNSTSGYTGSSKYNITSEPVSSKDGSSRNVTKANAKLHKVVVENFDISNFVVTNGRYNMRSVSNAILAIILRLIRNHRSQVTSSGDSPEKTVVTAGNATDSSETHKDELGVKFSDDLNVNVTDKKQVLSQEVPLGARHASINLTLFFTSNSSENSTTGANSIFEFPQKVKRDGSFDFVNAQGNESKARLLQMENKPNPNLEAGVGECTTDIPTGYGHSNSGFHCIFDNNVNLTEKARSIIDITNTILENNINIENSIGLSGENDDLFTSGLFDFGNYFRGLSEKSNGDNSQGSGISSPEGSIEIVFNYDENEVNIEVDELYVFFDFEGLKNDSNHITLAYNESVSNKTAPTSLRVTNEYDLSTISLSINETIGGEYPGPFDRIRDENCAVNCTDLATDFLCANNGITYRNICELRNAQCTDESLIFISFGECPPIVIMS